MLPATRPILNRRASGTCLPDVFDKLARENIHFRAAQMSMVVAGPGVGKSAFATVLAAKLAEQDIGVLYISADTDPHTMTCRLAASVTGATQEAIDEAIRVGLGADYLEAVDSLKRLQFCYDSSPSMDDIFEEIDAYGMVYGVFPELIIVDNLMDVYADGEELTGMKGILDELHQLARLTGAHVMVLHHATGEYENGNEPIPLKGVSNKVSKKPTLVLSMYRIHDEWTDSLGICPIKHRNGRADASAKWTLWFKIDLSRMDISEPKPVAPVQWSPSQYGVD